MVTLLILGIVVGIVIGGFVGCILTRNAMIKRSLKSLVGTLRVDTSDPDDNPYMFLELSKNVSDVTSRKSVILKVSTENYISQN